MTSTPFDRMTGKLARTGSRRAALRALGAAAAGFGRAWDANAEDEAETGGRFDKSCARNQHCSDDAICRRGVCACRSGYRRHEGRCIDLRFNSDHCGRYGHSCGEDATCIRGYCVPDIA
ncbi:MAG: EB domain-containing protein [Thermomicrobiales bacterium]